MSNSGCKHSNGRMEMSESTFSARLASASDNIVTHGKNNNSAIIMIIIFTIIIIIIIINIHVRSGINVPDESVVLLTVDLPEPGSTTVQFT